METLTVIAYFVFATYLIGFFWGALGQDWLGKTVSIIMGLFWPVSLALLVPIKILIMGYRHGKRS